MLLSYQWREIKQLLVQRSRGILTPFSQFTLRFFTYLVHHENNTQMYVLLRMVLIEFAIDLLRFPSWHTGISIQYQKIMLFLKSIRMLFDDSIHFLWRRTLFFLFHHNNIISSLLSCYYTARFIGLVL